MNPIKKAMDEINFRIPQELLRAAFVLDVMQGMEGIVSMETRIREQIIEPRVLVDLDIHGGTEAFLPLTPPVTYEYADPYTVIYHIPDEVVQNRPIVQVYSAHFGILGYQNAGMALQYTQGAMTAATQQVLDAAQRTPPASTSYLNLIAHNTVMVRYMAVPRASAFLRCRLGNDNALSHIRHQSYNDFANLCVEATKAYIYNKLLIPVDQGQLVGGQMLGVFREQLMSYADSDQIYRDLLIRWKKINVMNDPEARRRWIRTISGGY